MQAGKDVYVEKPVSHNVSEGRRIVQVARKTGRICQGGTQNRSSGALAAAIEYMRDGKLGEVKLARSIVYGRRGSIGGPGTYEIPAERRLQPLGSARRRWSRSTRPKFHYDWHWVWDTGNGELGNNNIHSLDICRWGLGVTGLGRSVISYGGRLGYTDAGETPNTQVCVFDFGDKTIVSETRGLKTEPFHPELQGRLRSSTAPRASSPAARSSTRRASWSARSRARPRTTSPTSSRPSAAASVADLNADILEGHQSTALCHIGNIS